MESRSYVVSVSCLMNKNSIPGNIPYSSEICENSDEWLTDGGSCIADPTGNWVIDPVVEKESLIIADLDPGMVKRERQNLDVTGHYSRPDVLKVWVNRERQRSIME
jgi:nitrilase